MRTVYLKHYQIVYFEYNIQSDFLVFYVQYRNVLSVMIRASIRPSGNASVISIAEVSQEAAEDSSIIPRL